MLPRPLILYCQLVRITTVIVVVQVGKIIGQKWREMSEEDKQPYCDEYEAEKLVYNEQMKVYRNSTAYKRWMEQKMLGTCHGYWC